MSWRSASSTSMPKSLLHTRTPSRCTVACGTSLGLRAGGSGRDPDLLPFGLAGRLRGFRLDPIEPITEPPWNRGTRLIGLVGMNFDAVDISQAERDFSQDAHGSGGVAAAEVVRVQPITDLERSRPDAAVQPEHPQDRPGLGMAQHIAVVGALVPVQLGFTPARCATGSAAASVTL